MIPGHEPESSSSDSPGDKPHRRRPRYPGKYPRRFEHKYKELHPDQHPDTVAKVRASGKTPAGSHIPIMVREVMEALALRPGQCGVDATLGHGGHAQAVLETIRPGGLLIGLDADPIELPRTEARLRGLGYGQGELLVRRSNYAGLPKVLEELKQPQVDFILADLGCSSMQLDDPSRGFTFKQDGPLDMRMNPNRGLSATDWLVRVSPSMLAAALRDNADEPRHQELAAALAGKRFPATRDLVHAIRQALGPHCPREEAELVIRRVFQAIRIEVNEEFTALETFLRMVPRCLKAKGRVVMLTFHSGEDRRVKKAFQAGEREGIYQSISQGVLTASPEERRANPRSAPAKLRWAMRA